ncbi:MULTISPECIES: LamG domain-containing protein [unclassified Nitratiruptor]|uniref:LamG domain-containing protein n=1 Tax=unclassified Nitratiruptor TaxID=2624044 RepID=UPI0019151AE9|nr:MULTISPECIES: LamG domain-containing protein [unclassified Nitratiruptor]BCD60877.1 hypothetical protein NitYY0810_C1655 [Nitratiruptor sp. YY08-10]BCD64809.1 hypothetical protein NitYY0814_C1663 [Nitratiruptor sp. YY08-14]
MKKFIILFLLLTSSLFADIILQGSLHVGDGFRSGWQYEEPLTKKRLYSIYGEEDGEHTYQYYLDNPSYFYLSQDTTITGFELINAIGLTTNTNIRLYIDSNLVATGSDGSDTVTIDPPLALSKGFHTIAVIGSCYRNGRERDCSSRRIDDIDDFTFDAIKLYSDVNTTAVVHLDHLHTGNTDDYDDWYDIENSSIAYYPDAPLGNSYTFDINITDNLVGFEVLIPNMRDVHQNNVNTIKVYDKNNNLITTFYINHNNTDKFNFDVIYDQNVSGIKQVVINSNYASNIDDIDDLSFDGIVVVPYYSFQELYNVKIDYHFDECSWDNDPNTYEIKNYGLLGNEYNLTAFEQASQNEGQVCRGGNFISDDTHDKALLPKNNIPLPSEYTLNLWIKFPLDENGHKEIDSDFYYFNIADRPGQGGQGDYIFFAHQLSNNIWSLNINDDNGKDSINFNPQHLNGWHMLTFVVTSNGTKFYLDGEYNDSLYTHPSGEIGLLFNSDYQTGNNQPNWQSLGALADEFKIFGRVLSQSQIQTIYDNESNGKNYDGSPRICPVCGGPIIRSGLFNAVDIVTGSCSAENHWDDNITTKIVNKDFNLTVLAKAADGSSGFEANITKVSLYLFDSSSSGACSGSYTEVSVCTDCGTTKNGCLPVGPMQVDRAKKCVLVHIEGKDINSTSNDVNESNSTDNFAIRPDHFSLTAPASMVAGKDTAILVDALDEANQKVIDYNETLHVRGASVDIEYNETKIGCKTGTFEIVSGDQFQNGEANMSVRYSEVGEINVTVQEVNGTEFASIDSDDTSLSQRLITPVSTTLSFKPDHFDINGSLHNFQDHDFTYLSDDLNMSAYLPLVITAKNALGDTTTNYNTNCYAKDIDINISHTSVPSNNLNSLLYLYEDANDQNSSVTWIDKNATITIQNYPASNFTTDHNGSAYITLYCNFDRNSSKPVDPFELNITGTNVVDTDRVEGSSSDINGTANFYYARFRTDDLATSESEDNTTAQVLVYDSSDTKFDTNQTLMHWYVNAFHSQSDGDIRESNVSSSTTLQASDIDDSFSLNWSQENGIFTITINNTSKTKETRYIHLDIPSWLWFSYGGGSYSYDIGSDCTQHPCIKYNYIPPTQTKGVKSGTVSGVDFDQNVTSSKRGVKVYR